MTSTSKPASGFVDISYMQSYRYIKAPKFKPRQQKLIASQHSRFRQALLWEGMDYRIALLGRTPHTPSQIPASALSSQNMNDVVAVLSDPFFFVSDAHHELSKRGLKVSGSKDELLRRLFEALEAEHMEGWTSGYLLSTRIIPFDGRGRDPRSLIGHHVAGCNCVGDGSLTLELSDGEDMAVLSTEPSDECSTIKMDHDLFWALHALDGMKAVPRNLREKPLLIIEAVTGLRKNRWGKEAGNVFGLKLEGMRAISFLFLAGKTSIREDRIRGDVWLAENDVLREDIRMLHGGNVMMAEEEREREW